MASRISVDYPDEVCCGVGDCMVACLFPFALCAVHWCMLTTDDQTAMYRMYEEYRMGNVTIKRWSTAVQWMIDRAEISLQRFPGA